MKRTLEIEKALYSRITVLTTPVRAVICSSLRIGSLGVDGSGKLLCAG